MKRSPEQRIRIAMRSVMASIHSVRKLIDENPGHAHLEVLRIRLSEDYAALHRALIVEVTRREMGRNDGQRAAH